MQIASIDFVEWFCAPGHVLRCLRLAALTMIIAFSTAPEAFAQSPVVSPDQLHALGLLAAGEKSLSNDGYAQLRVVIYIPDAQNDVALDQCPKHGIWDINLDALLAGNRQATFGLKITLPNNGTSTFVDFTPFDLTKEKKFLGSKCNIKIDVLKYSSPIYYVRNNSNTNGTFDLAPNYHLSKKIDPQVQANVATAVSAASTLAGIPGPIATPLIKTMTNALSAASVDSTSIFVQHAVIQAGPVAAPFTWSLTNSETDVVGLPKMVLIAQLIPVDSIITLDGQQTSAVLRSPFRIGASPAAISTDGTIGDYVEKQFSSQVNAYQTAQAGELNLACNNLAGSITGMGLSDRDAALVLWAETRWRVAAGKDQGSTIDSLPCLSNMWHVIQPLGLTPSPPPVPPPAPGQAPTVAQMQIVTDVRTAFARFFVSPAWVDQNRYGSLIFAYPLQFNDPDAALLRQSKTAANGDGISVAEYREQALLETVGCYAYFDINADPTGYARTFGAHSLMIAIGKIGQNGGPSAGKEVAIIASFNETPGGSTSKIAQMDVMTALPPSARQAMLRQLGGPVCDSGYRPQMLAGD
ncbi:hypothetical protein [Sphingomonas azotifigens]|uniref:hypothetical protein n=1 Tax=Sphingomonas azotifigens TaxID=330920 RepID=UPI000A061F74|nr:hypothetical protein [Sphingomonas azotifigens]